MRRESMEKSFSQRDLEIWQLGMDLVVDLYQLTKSFPEDERFGLISQLRRAAVSVPTNISEGWGRNSQANLANFIRIARGSLCEIDTLVELEVRIGLISTDAARSINEQIDHIGRKSFLFLKKIEGNTVREAQKAYAAGANVSDVDKALAEFGI